MLRLFFIIRSAEKALRANMVRSSLTILGIVIGITAIMLIVSLGEGAQGLILGQIQGLGAETIVVRPGREPSGPSDFAQTLFGDSIKDREVEALKKRSNVPDLVSLAPALFISESVSYGNETYRPTIFGWSAEFMLSVSGAKVKEGTIFDEEDIKQEAAVAVIGPEVADNLFAGEEPLGKNIRIKGKNFRVIGVLGTEGSSPFFNVSKVVIIPYTTAKSYVSGTDHYQEVILKVSSPEAVARSVEDIERTLRELHNITDPEKDDFYIETQQGAIDQIGTVLAVLTAFLSAVVAISLVVGGIGVMNVMLVSVTERTREIGLRKALGARRKDILTQFLLESVMLTLVGGAIGVFLGVSMSYASSLALSAQLNVDWAFTFPWKAAAIGLGVSAGVGLVFGGYPAWKASRKSPIEALRYE